MFFPFFFFNLLPIPYLFYNLLLEKLGSFLRAKKICLKSPLKRDVFLEVYVNFFFHHYHITMEIVSLSV